jgi:hypothetical protein
MGSAGRGEKTLFGVEKGEKTRQGKVAFSFSPRLRRWAAEPLG